jgi:hypothetical protein
VPAQRGDNWRCVFAGHFDQDGKTRMSFHQCCDVTVPGAAEQIALPTTVDSNRLKQREARSFCAEFTRWPFQGNHVRQQHVFDIGITCCRENPANELSLMRDKLDVQSLRSGPQRVSGVDETCRHTRECHSFCLHPGDSLGRFVIECERG